MKKKVLVIGANGFTGRRILNDLSRNDEYIVQVVLCMTTLLPIPGIIVSSVQTSARWGNKAHCSGKYARI